MSTKEAAKFLGVQPNTLAVWRSKGINKIPYLRLGRKILYKKSDLIQYIEANSAK